MDASIIVPLFNEEDNVIRLFDRIEAAMTGLDLHYEILFVDDGSSDRTFTRSSELARRVPHVRVIRFRRNYGQTPAMVAGIDHACGHVLITMDGDLQNDPEDIPLFLEQIGRGYDIVVGWRFDRQDRLITRKVPSRVANWLIGKVTGVPIKDNGCSLKAYRAQVIKQIPLYSEMHRFIPAMSSLAGTRVAEIKVRHHARQFGQSKYGLSRIYKVLFDLIVIKTLLVSVRSPMRVFGIVGIGSSLLGTGIIAAAAVGAWRSGVDSWLMLFGTGLLYLSVGLVVILTGLLSTLLYRTGDVSPALLASLTSQRTDWLDSAGLSAQEVNAAEPAPAGVEQPSGHEPV